jgi:chemotaxis signal transduction protein
LFELAGSTCGVPSHFVQSVEMVEHITAVPNTLPSVLGITFLRGQVIPSISLRIRLGFPLNSGDLRSRMLVVRPKGRIAGLLVDSVREFISIPRSAMQPFTEASKGDRSGTTGLIDGFVEAVAVIGSRLILILNLDDVLEGV